MQGHLSYQDFDLLIEPGTQGRYRARVLRSPAGESGPVQFTVPFSPLELENFVLKVGLARRRARGPGRPEGVPLKDFGGKLYGAVFQDELREVLLRSISLTNGPGAGLRLRLRLADAPELAELPWEFLYDPRLNRFLAQSRRTPLVRYLDLPDPPRPLAVDGPLRLLVMISSPAGYPLLDVERELRLLTEALAEQQEEGRVVVEHLAANMGTLRRRLRREEFHVFHFVGHGLYRPDWDDGVLVMEDRHGQPQEVTGEELGSLLNEYDPTRLAVLNACEGARSSAHDSFAGVAQSLIQQGLPAVVAMQFAITDDAAITFAQELYAAIADGYPLEAALAEARRAIRDEGNPTEWGTPVLYSRAPDGRLFDLTVQARIPAAEPKAREDDERQARDEADRKAQEVADQRPWQADADALEKRARSAGDAGEYAAARDQFAALLPERERVSGPEHPDTLAARGNLARWTREAGDAVAARDQFAALVPVRERAFGPKHLDTLIARASLARWTGEAGDTVAARDQFATLQPIIERVLGPRHWAAISNRNSLSKWTGRAAAGAVLIEELNLRVRSYNSLRRVGIRTIDDLSSHTEAELLAIENLGPQGVEEVKQRLADIGRHLA